MSLLPVLYNFSAIALRKLFIKYQMAFGYPLPATCYVLTADRRLLTANCRLPTADCLLPTAIIRDNQCFQQLFLLLFRQQSDTHFRIFGNTLFGSFKKNKFFAHTEDRFFN